jgi:predicted CopG family antitoxin
MTVRLNITMREDLYRRLKKELPPKGMSAFINEAVQARLRPDRRALDAAYREASEDPSRQELGADWTVTETEGWPE